MWETRSPRSRVWAWSKGGSDWAPLVPQPELFPAYLSPLPQWREGGYLLSLGDLLLLTVPTQLTSAASSPPPNLLPVFTVS